MAVDFAQQLGDALSISDILDIPEDVLDEMLSVGADIGKAALEQEIREKGLVDTGQFVKSLKKKKKANEFGQPYYLVYPTGKRKADNARHTRHRKKRDTTPKSKYNGVVGLVYEFGDSRRGIPATQWARAAMEKCADDVLAAELEVYDRYLFKK